ncbi:MAG: hypothetical protein AB1730_12480 [Myxococcota bacterium]|jgi:hypothetical protein
MRSLQHAPFALAVAALLSACPKKEEPPPSPTPPPVVAVDAGPRAPDPLAAVAEKLRTTCDAEFARVASENLVAGADAADCTLPEKANFMVTLARARLSLAELPAAMKPACAAVQEELDAEVKRAAASPTPRAESETKRMVEHFDRVVLVGVVADPGKLVQPRVNFGKDGKPSSFVRGGVEGTAYLYSLRDGKVVCASRVSSVSSLTVESLRAQGVDESTITDLDLDWDVAKGVADMLEKAPRLALVPAPAKK